jgi:hypothetical protein
LQVLQAVGADVQPWPASHVMPSGHIDCSPHDIVPVQLTSQAHALLQLVWRWHD